MRFARARFRIEVREFESGATTSAPTMPRGLVLVIGLKYLKFVAVMGFVPNPPWVGGSPSDFRYLSRLEAKS